MKCSFGSFSERGPRAVNEDAVGAWFHGEGVIAAVADGLGGMGGGDFASSLAISALAEYVKSSSVTSNGLMDVVKLIHTSIRERQLSSEGLSSMATTLSLAWISGEKLFGLHCGDSRVMILRGNGIKKLTKDQTEAMRLYEEGKLTKSEYVNYPRKNVLYSALGGNKEPDIQAFSFEVMAGDWVILSSDGVHQRVSTPALRDIVVQSKDVGSCIEYLQNYLHVVGVSDNYSAIVIRLEAV